MCKGTFKKKKFINPLNPIQFDRKAQHDCLNAFEYALKRTYFAFKAFVLYLCGFPPPKKITL